MKSISSRDNPFFKTLRKLAGSAKERRRSGKTLLDGVHLIAGYCEAGGQPESIIVSRSGLGNAEIGSFLRNIPTIELVELPDAMFGEVAPVSTPTGILAVIRIPIPPGEPSAPCNFCVLLEDIQDPGNLGSILRSAAGAGVAAAYLSRNCADAWSPKVLRAGMGAHFHLRILESADLPQVAREFGGVVIATSLDARKSLYEVDLTGPVAFVIGNEGAGVSPELLDAATERVWIPMPGGIESLNAAAAAAVCLFERVRQCARQPGGDAIGNARARPSTIKP